MSTTDLIRKVHKLIKEYNKALNDYDNNTFELHRMLTDINEVLVELNAYSYERCKSFYTYYHIVENRKGFMLGASLVEK